VQEARYADVASAGGPSLNAHAEGELLDRVATPDAPGLALLTEAAERMHLTARGYHRVLRVARTLADLDGAEHVRRIHVAEALAYREPVAGRLGAAV
ncbi:MAG: ATP-binding protein, partial [Parvibaculum sp.]